MALSNITRIQLRRGTTAALEAVNETPKAGEPILDVEKKTLKFGDGETSYNDLPSMGGGGLTDEEKAQLVTKTELEDYAKTEDLPDVSDMLTKTEAGTTYATKTDISDMETKTDAAATYATKTELPDVSEFVKQDELTELDLSMFPSKEEMTGLLTRLEAVEAKFAEINGGTVQQSAE